MIGTHQPRGVLFEEDWYLYAVMRGYFDESGTHDNRSRVTTLAGYVMSKDQCRRLLPLWQDALARDGEGLGVFHANEFNRYTTARKWSDEKKDQFLAKLAGIINENVWQGFSGSVVVSDYNQLPDWVRKQIGGRYHFCFGVLMHLLRQRTESLITQEPMILTFDRKDRVSGRVVDDFNDILADNPNRFGPLWFDSKENSPLLQVADFLVYEINHWIDNALHTGKPVRPALKKLAEKPKIHYRYHDKDTLKGLPALLIKDRDKLLAGRHPLDIWWPPSWHMSYEKKGKYIDYLGKSPDRSKRK